MEARAFPSIGIPQFAACIVSPPNLKAIGLAPATIAARKSGYISAALGQLLYMEGCFSVLQCVLTAKSKMRGLSLNTGAGVVTPKTIGDLAKLIDAGIR